MSDEPRPEPVTSDDIRGLRVDFRGLTHSVDNLAARQKVTDEAVAKKVDQSTLDALAELEQGRRTNRRLAVAALALILVGFGFVIRSNSDRLDEQARSRNDARAVACQNANTSAQAQRQLWEGILALPRAEGSRPPDPAVLAQFNALLDKTFPLRDCSPAGIEAYYSKPGG